ncbi:FtsX-like permease family protein [Salinisphaera sp. T31B1]|uniref:ABC transporter permease n=1 Tax=Salinisphaera sp. T31B1 TaxID=727963 RepID=UPI003341471F
MSSSRPRTSAFGLAWRHGARAQGKSAWTILLVALIVAVAAVTAVNQMTDRVRAGMTRQGGVTIAADLKLDLREPLDARRAAWIDEAGVHRAATTVFPSVVSGDDQVTLVSVKAVTPDYPLRGDVTLRRGAPGSPQTRIRQAPPPGHVWVEQRVLDAQGLGVGDTLTLGEARLVIDAVLVVEPDRGPGFANIAPRVMMAAADLKATGLLGPGSRAQYAELLAGPPAAVSALRERLAGSLGTGERLRTPAESNRALARALERADVFLDLAALVAVVLAGVAIALTARQHATSRLDEIALLKTLGAPRGLITRMLAWQLAIVGILGIGLGLALGSLAQAGISVIIARAFEIDLPAAGWAAYAAAPLTGAVLLAGFAWPALAGARRTPPARVLARSLDGTGGGPWPVYLAAIAATLVLAAAATGDVMLTVWVVVATATGIALLGAGAFALLWCVAWLRGRLGARLGPGLRLGLAATGRRRAASILQIVAFGVGLIMLFMLVIVRGDLLSGWQTDIAADAPNRFLINITPDQRTQVADYLHGQGIDAQFYPLVRGRLTAVNGQAIDADPQRAEAAGELTRRELNLSWTATLKPDNRIVAGRWFDPNDAGTPRVSIDESVAERLDAGLGDRLSFDIAGREIAGEVTSIRSIDWSSLQANFYVLFAPETLAGFPATYITSFYLPPERHGLIVDLVRTFPNVSVIDIDAILDQLTTLVDRVSLAVELVFGFTLAAGLVVLVAAMQASLGQRRREAALLRALGARSRWLVQATLVECALIGLCSSMLAAIVAQAAAIVLATQVLDLSYSWRSEVWLAAIAVATLVITASGVIALRDILRQPAWTSLRAAD